LLVGRLLIGFLLKASNGTQTPRRIDGIRRTRTGHRRHAVIGSLDTRFGSDFMRCDWIVLSEQQDRPKMNGGNDDHCTRDE
jgi:hypothetical protein